MKKLLISIILIVLLFLIGSPTHANSTTILYFPMLYGDRSDGLGLHIEMGGGPGNAVALAELQVEVVRTFFANDQGLNIYQVYLSGGWSAVDTMVLPDINSIKTYSEPLISFTYGGLCKVPTNAQLNQYAIFLSAFVVRYNITYFEGWNEVDTKGGIPSMLGCFGDQNISKLIYLIQKIRETLPAGKMLGVSFAMTEPADFIMYTAIVPYLDWVAVHHYGVWSNGVVLEPYPGTLSDLYNLVAPQDIPIWLTEVNLRDPADICSVAFRQAQMEYNRGALETEFERKIILVFAGGNNWQCTGIKDSLTHEMLKFPQGWW